MALNLDSIIRLNLIIVFMRTRLWRLMALLLIVTCSVGITSCGGDEEKDEPDDPYVEDGYFYKDMIVGKWFSGTYGLAFGADGGGYDFAPTGDIDEYFRWHISGRKLTLNFEDSEKGVYDIVSLSFSEMVLKNANGVFSTYSRWTGSGAGNQVDDEPQVKGLLANTSWKGYIESPGVYIELEFYKNGTLKETFGNESKIIRYSEDGNKLMAESGVIRNTFGPEATFAVNGNRLKIYNSYDSWSLTRQN